MKKLIQKFFFSTNLNKKRNTSKNFFQIIENNKYDIVFNIGAQTTNKNNTSDKVLANTFSNAHFILIEPLITLIPDEKHNEIINREYKSFMLNLIYMITAFLLNQIKLISILKVVNRHITKVQNLKNKEENIKK